MFDVTTTLAALDAARAAVLGINDEIAAAKALNKRANEAAAGLAEIESKTAFLQSEFDRRSADVAETMKSSRLDLEALVAAQVEAKATLARLIRAADEAEAQLAEIRRRVN